MIIKVNGIKKEIIIDKGATVAVTPPDKPKY